MKILTAAEWGRNLLPGKHLEQMDRPATYWIIHHTAGSTRRSLADELRMVNADALDEGKTAIDYSFAVTQAGEIGEGRGWGIVGAHTGTSVKAGLPRAGESYNRAGHAIVFVGNYHDVPGDTPTRPQLDAAAWLIAEGVRLGHVDPAYIVIGHRTAGHANGATACPGDRLFALIPDLAAAANQLLTAPTRQELDMARIVLHPDNGTNPANAMFARLLDDGQTIRGVNGCKIRRGATGSVQHEIQLPWRAEAIVAHPLKKDVFIAVRDGKTDTLGLRFA